MNKKLPITAIILTYNEEKNLPYCLENIKNQVSEIVVVDSFSDDKTEEIAKKYDAKFYEHEFINQAQQFNWALDNIEINNPWVIRLDADEWVTKELWKEIEEKLKNTPDDINGYILNRRTVFMGKWIKYGGFYPTPLLRLFRKGKARSEERAMDEHLVLLEGKTATLKNDFVDENRKGLTDWIRKHNSYATREVETIMNNQTPRTAKRSFYNKLPLFCRAFGYYFYRYFIRLGFLDGIEGLIYHFLQGLWYRLLVDAKIYEYRKQNKEK